MEQALDDPEVAVILLDVVLGYGAHSNPSEAVVEAMQGIADNKDKPVVIASVCGTEFDPQGLHQQRAALTVNGITVCNCNVAAAELAAEVINQLS